MKQEQVTVGMQARVKIGSRLAVVTVEREIDRPGRRMQYQCLTADTGRRITATSARLRPMPPPAVLAMVDRMVSASVARAEVAATDPDAIVIDVAVELARWAQEAEAVAV